MLSALPKGKLGREERENVRVHSIQSFSQQWEELVIETGCDQQQWNTKSSQILFVNNSRGTVMKYKFMVKPFVNGIRLSIFVIEMRKKV